MAGRDLRDRGIAAKKRPRINAPVPRMDEMVMVDWMVVVKAMRPDAPGADSGGGDVRSLEAPLLNGDQKSGRESDGAESGAGSSEWRTRTANDKKNKHRCQLVRSSHPQEDFTAVVSVF